MSQIIQLQSNVYITFNATLIAIHSSMDGQSFSVQLAQTFFPKMQWKK